MEKRYKEIKSIILFFLMLSLSVTFCRATLNKTHFPPEHKTFNSTLYAVCRMRPNTQLAPGMPKVYGRILFKEISLEKKLKVMFRLHGLPPSATQFRAIHIHQYGDLSEGCTSTSGHYNPFGVNHPNHPGDFGNFMAPKGKIHSSVESSATLYGGSSVLGRAVVIHEKQDDLGQGQDEGSLLHGNAGVRLACCVIGMSSPTLWNKYNKLNSQMYSG